jgi:hypothetical protein
MHLTREALRGWISGRWGPRRVRVTECAAVFRAEELYDRIVRARRVNPPGARGYMETSADAPEWRLAFDGTANRQWTLGRLFYLCPRCASRATRLYAPTVEDRPECRRCWGLTYSSRLRTNYKGRPFCGISASEWARSETAERRQAARAAARERYMGRRQYLRA